jgi:large subunit ribosomal protein L20
MENLLTSILTVAILYILATLPRTATTEPEAAPVDYFPEVPEVEPEESPELAPAPETPLIVDEVAKTELAPQKPTKTSPKTDKNGLDALSIRQLKKLASEHKIPRYSNLTKSQLITALAA